MSVRRPWILLFVVIVGAKKLSSLFRRAARKAGRQRPDGFSKSVPRTIPKTIWMYWDGGEAEAPAIVQFCIASWRERNPDWTVRILSKSTIADVIDMPNGLEEIPVQSFADLLRLRLLRLHGGVWADATTYCVQPLDCWLPALSQRGFFSFNWTATDRWFIWPGISRSLTNWFLASEPEGAIITPWETRAFDYWKDRKTPHIYYWPHVLFEFLLLSNTAFRREYAAVPKIGSYGPHLVHDCVTRGRETELVVKLLASGAVPVQKLRWDWSTQQQEMAKSLLLAANSMSSKS